MCMCVYACAVINFSYVFVIILWVSCLLFSPKSSILLYTIFSGSCACFSSSWFLYPLRCITIVLCLFLGLHTETVSVSYLVGGGGCSRLFCWGQVTYWSGRGKYPIEVPWVCFYVPCSSQLQVLSLSATFLVKVCAERDKSKFVKKLSWGIAPYFL